MRSKPGIGWARVHLDEDDDCLAWSQYPFYFLSQVMNEYSAVNWSFLWWIARVRSDPTTVYFRLFFWSQIPNIIWIGVQNRTAAKMRDIERGMDWWNGWKYYLIYYTIQFVLYTSVSYWGIVCRSNRLEFHELEKCVLVLYQTILFTHPLLNSVRVLIGDVLLVKEHYHQYQQYQWW